MEDPLKICSALLLELVNRWSVENKSFRIREHLVSFNFFYVYVVLGFSVREEKVCFDSCTTGLVNNLFGNEDITIEKIVLKLEEEDNVDNYCRLYILLLFSVFYFPRTFRTVTTFPFRLLDNLQSLHRWNWCEAVHSLLVKSLDRASTQFRQQKNTDGLHLAGCVAVLQVFVWLNLNYAYCIENLEVKYLCC